MAVHFKNCLHEAIHKLFGGVGWCLSHPLNFVFLGYCIKDEIHIIADRACSSICGAFDSLSKCTVWLCTLFLLWWALQSSLFLLVDLTSVAWSLRHSLLWLVDMNSSLMWVILILTCICSDLADWLGVGEIGLFNFKPSVRPVPLEVHIQASVLVFRCTLFFNCPILQELIRWLR